MPSRLEGCRKRIAAAERELDIVSVSSTAEALPEASTKRGSPLPRSSTSGQLWSRGSMGVCEPAPEPSVEASVGPEENIDVAHSEDLRIQISHLEKQLLGLETKCRDIEGERKELGVAKQCLVNDLAASVERESTLMSELKVSRDQERLLHQSLGVSKGEVQQLRSRVEFLESRETIMNLQANTLSAELYSYQSRLEDTEEKLQVSTTGHQALVESTSDLQIRENAARGDVEALIARLKAVGGAHDEAEREAKLAREKLEVTAAELVEAKEVIKSFAAEVEQLRATITEMVPVDDDTTDKQGEGDDGLHDNNSFTASQKLVLVASLEPQPAEGGAVSNNCGTLKPTKCQVDVEQKVLRLTPLRVSGPVRNINLQDIVDVAPAPLQAAAVDIKIERELPSHGFQMLRLVGGDETSASKLMGELNSHMRMEPGTTLSSCATTVIGSPKASKAPSSETP